MTPQEILTIVQLFSVIEPAALNAINSSITFFSSSTLSSDDKIKALGDIAAALKPMELKA